jgi:hypothetical protein
MSMVDALEKELHTPLETDPELQLESVDVEDKLRMLSCLCGIMGTKFRKVEGLEKLSCRRGAPKLRKDCALVKLSWRCGTTRTFLIDLVLSIFSAETVGWLFHLASSEMLARSGNASKRYLLIVLLMQDGSGAALSSTSDRSAVSGRLSIAIKDMKPISSYSCSSFIMMFVGI